MSLGIPNAVLGPRCGGTASPKRTLLSLPGEVRGLIYEAVFQDARLEDQWPSGLEASRHELLLTNKSIYKEGIDLYYKHLRLIMDCWTMPDIYGWHNVGTVLKAVSQRSGCLPLRNMAKIQNLHLVIGTALPDLPRFESLHLETIAPDRDFVVSSKAVISTSAGVQEQISTLACDVHSTLIAWTNTFAEGSEVRCEYKFSHYSCHSEHVVSISACHTSELLTSLSLPLVTRIEPCST
jgi:hypothetical protein